MERRAATRNALLVRRGAVGGMNGAVETVISGIISRYGKSVSGDPRRIEGLLRDLAGDHPREIAVLVAAARAGVPQALLAQASPEEAELLAPRLVAQLEDGLGLAPDAATWAVSTWARALDVEVGTSLATGPASPSAAASSARPLAWSNLPPPSPMRLPNWKGLPKLPEIHIPRRAWVAAPVALGLLVLVNFHPSPGVAPAAGSGATGAIPTTPVAQVAATPMASADAPTAAPTDTAAATTSAPALSPSSAPFSACPAAGGSGASASSVTTGLPYSGTQGQGGVEVVVLGPGGAQQGVYSEVHAAKTDVLGKPIAGDQVASGRSDSTGAARMEVPPGTYAVLTGLTGYNWGDLQGSQGLSGVVVKSGRTTRVTVSMGTITFVPTTTAGTISGQYAEVHLQKTDSQGGVVTGDQVASGRTDNTGAVSFLVTPGSYVLRSSFAGYNWGDLSDGQGCSSVAVAPQANTKVAIPLGRLRVAVPEGTYVEVHLGSAAAPGDQAASGRADNTGYWTTDLTPGAYVVVKGDTRLDVTVGPGQVTDAK